MGRGNGAEGKGKTIRSGATPEIQKDLIPPLLRGLNECFVRGERTAMMRGLAIALKGEAAHSRFWVILNRLSEFLIVCIL